MMPTRQAGALRINLLSFLPVLLTLWFSDGFLMQTSGFAVQNVVDRSLPLFSTARGKDSPPTLPSKVYLDIEVQGTPLGRLVFDLTIPSPLPLHTENFVRLCRGDNKGIDPLATYIGCAFDYTPDYIEDGMGRYRWGHVLKGKGRNAVGRPMEAISEPEEQRACTHSCFGGQYYGDVYDPNEYPGVCLTIPILGPGGGSSRFSIVRVGESPQEWRERLLLNSAVIGRLEEGSLPTLHAMARQRMGPPTIAACGAL